VSEAEALEVEMLKLKKRFIIDEYGSPRDVIISMEDFQKIEELLGLDLDDEAIADLRQARRDREAGNKEAYVSLDAIE